MTERECGQLLGFDIHGQDGLMVKSMFRVKGLPDGYSGLGFDSQLDRIFSLPYIYLFIYLFIYLAKKKYIYMICNLPASVNIQILNYRTSMKILL